VNPGVAIPPKGKHQSPPMLAHSLKAKPNRSDNNNTTETNPSALAPVRLNSWSAGSFPLTNP